LRTKSLQRCPPSGRILIVDDDERQRTALAAMLSDCDFDTQVAGDGQEALERLIAFNADVIVADLVMPRMDGFELLRHLKERGDLTPTITLTGFGSMEKALSAVHDLKAFWFLEKPVEPRAFKILLGRAIRFPHSTLVRLKVILEHSRGQNDGYRSQTQILLLGRTSGALRGLFSRRHFALCLRRGGQCRRSFERISSASARGWHTGHVRFGARDDRHPNICSGCGQYRRPRASYTRDPPRSQSTEK
jgi:CheY-like chemotaxis protein